MIDNETVDNDNTNDSGNDIAIIGMTGRFPEAKDVEAFWENLSKGVESVKFFNHEQLASMGIDDHLLDNPEFVAADAVLDDVDLFDARFFNMSPREAEITDPQHRMFLEAAWELMERAGYSPQKYSGRVGVYAGAALSGYMLRNLKSNPGLIERVGTFKIMLANDKDFLSTKVSYHMGFTGPSINVNTLCSSSAVAIHLASEALLNHQCDLAMAGGVSIQVTRNEAFFYQEGKIGAPDGHCRAFDERAAGTVSGSGLGIIALKRLGEAIADNDNILAVLKGSAVNNDGNKKASYTAPSTDGQAEVIIEAQELAGVDPDTITYIEAHGTGTHLGDPIEVAGLTKAFSRQTSDRQYCALGSVKTNIGHLVTAGGVASVIKTVLALQHKKLPASLNFERPNPKIDFANSPFFVNTQLIDWKARKNAPLRAGVSSFGIGGTNVHMVLEQAPAIKESDAGKPWLFFPLSAKSETALNAMQSDLARFLTANPGLNLADAAYTLQVGRNDFEYRKAYVADSAETLLAQLQQHSADGSFVGIQKHTERLVVFMFPGQGAQYARMGAELYQLEPVFRQHLDECCAIFERYLKVDLKTILFGTDIGEANEALKSTAVTQPVLFAIEYALAKLWQHWGLKPQALIGHSIGEYVAACLSAVFSLEDAVKLVAHRAKLMGSMPEGAMLSIALPADEVSVYLNEELWLAAENGAALSVVSGTHAAIKALETQLDGRSIQHSRLHTSHAFHSGLMEQALAPYLEILSTVAFSAPTIPFISNVSGDWISAEQACDPQYWAQQLRAPVLFARGMEKMAEDDQRLLLEVGPAQVLCQLAKQTRARELTTLSSMPSAKRSDAGYRHMTETLAQLWLAGVDPDWSRFYAGTRRIRVVLPTYPFERQRFWIEEKANGVSDKPDVLVHDSSELADIVGTGKEFDKGFLPLEIDCSAFSDDLETRTRQLGQLLEFSEQVRQLSKECSSKTGFGIRVPALGLRSTGENRASDDVLQYSERVDTSTAYVEAATESQKLLLAHWREILGIKQIGIHDNFFDLGGNSLLAAALAVKLRSQFPWEIPLADLLELPTIAQLADMLDTKMWLASGRDGALEDAELCEEGTL